jgi:hypothetical protein
MSDLKVGDKVKVVDYCAWYNGQEGEISVINGLEALVCLRGLHFRFKLSNLESVSNKESSMNEVKSKFKVGDKVRIIKEGACYGGLKVGDVFTISSFSESEGLAQSNEGGTFWLREIELVQENNMNEVESKFQIGDRVEVIGPSFYNNSSALGRVSIITKISSISPLDYMLEDVPKLVFLASSLKLASKFKVGDAVLYRGSILRTIREVKDSKNDKDGKNYKYVIDNVIHKDNRLEVAEDQLEIADKYKVNRSAIYDGKRVNITHINIHIAILEDKTLAYKGDLQLITEIDGEGYVKVNGNYVPYIEEVKFKVGGIVEFTDEDGHLIADKIISISNDVYETIDYCDLKASELKLVENPRRLKDNDYVITNENNIYRVAKVDDHYYLFCALNGIGAGNTELSSMPYLNSKGYYVIGGYQYKPHTVELKQD